MKVNHFDPSVQANIILHWIFATRIQLKFKRKTARKKWALRTGFLGEISKIRLDSSRGNLSLSSLQIKVNRINRK